MSKLRLLFIKEAQASYISHLDLLRTFQRAFPRTELDIKHSQGYHPHPIISIVLPLPVGQSSEAPGLRGHPGHRRPRHRRKAQHRYALRSPRAGLLSGVPPRP